MHPRDGPGEVDIAKSDLKLIDFGMAQNVGVKRSRIAFDGCLRERGDCAPM